MSELKYDGDPSEPELYKNFIISIDSEQPNKTILLSLHTLWDFGKKKHIKNC